MDIVGRAKNILLTPSAEWEKIDGESHSVQGLYTGWIMILAAIPAIATFIGLSIFGVGAWGVSVRVPIVTGAAHAITTYVLALATVYLVALVIDALAPTFNGEKNFLQAFKVAAFAPTASWLAGIFGILPGLSILSLLGLYSLYLLFVGLPKLMKAPDEKALPYTAVVVVVVFIVTVVVSAVGALLLPGRGMGF